MRFKKNTTEDPSFIESLRIGDQVAFENLYRLYFKPLCAFSSQYTNYEEAEEIVQETMIWLWEHREILTPGTMIHSLLFTIVRNKSLNVIARDQSRSKILEQIRLSEEENVYDPSYCTNEEINKLYEKALTRVTPDFRKTFELNRMEGFTHREIATKLNVSEQTVNYRICRTLHILKDVFKDYLL
ncbi:MAG: RNA polymerase sigma-70 factor [Bacteroidales bacterium]